MSFLDSFADWRREIVLIKNFRRPDETRQAITGVIRPKCGMFAVDTPIYEGDVIELPDPRGGVRRLLVGEVEINDDPDDPDMSHIAVTFTGSPA